jgi:hypothetical protein
MCACSTVVGPMRIALAVLLALHGAIHLLGFSKAWGLAAVPQLTGRTLLPLGASGTRALGAGWLLATVCLVASAAMVLTRQSTWWPVAAAGVALSQALVIFQWHDAKAGTVANVVIAVAVLVGAADARFRARVDDEVRSLLAGVPSSPARAVVAEDLAQLPPPVKRWLEVSGVVGRPRARAVRLRQRGEMRTSPDGAWMPAAAEQYFVVDDPGFVWHVDVTMMHVLPIAGRDAYVGGKGNMLIEAASLVPVVDARGPKIDQGSMLRFLGEIVWFPSAALAPAIRWEPIDERRARAIMTNRGLSASAELTFDERGRFASMTAERYYGDGGLERWFIPATEWREIRGVEIPVRGSVVWKLAGGDFDYFRWEILDVETNEPRLYADDAARRHGA